MPYTLHPPPEVIASWPTPNYTDPENRGPGLIYVCIILNAIVILAILARLYSRLLMTKAPGYDDLLAVIALAFGIALSILVAIGNKVYLSGHHVWDIPISKSAGSRLNVWVSEWCYVVSATCIKISVLLFYKRISVTFSKSFLIATWIGIVYNICYLIGFGMALCLICRPLSAYWNSFDPQWAATHTWQCGKETLSLPLSGVFSVIGDFYSTALPLVLVMNLDLPRRQKYSLYALFALGFVVVAAGIRRTILLNELINEDYDFTWVLWETWIWALVELYVAILCASAPALKPFVRRFVVDPISTMVDSDHRRDFTDKSADEWSNEHQNPISREQMRSPKSNPTSNPDVNPNSFRNIQNRENKAWFFRGRVNRNSRIYPDPDNIGIAHGGGDRTREESLSRQLDNRDLDTRHFELRHSSDGKIVPTQVWRRPNTSSGASAKEVSVVTALPLSQTRTSDDMNWPVPPSGTPVSPIGTGQVSRVIPPPIVHIGPQMQHVRNFSQPHPISDSVAGRSTPQLGPRRLPSKGNGSVKNARLRAQAQLAEKSGEPQTPPTIRAGAPPEPEPKKSSDTIRRQRPLNIYAQNRKADELIGNKHLNTSRLDSPSNSDDDDDEEELIYPPRPKRKTKASLKSNKSLVRSLGEQSRSTSEETLHLPRMGSKDFNPEPTPRPDFNAGVKKALEQQQEQERIRLQQQHDRLLGQQGEGSIPPHLGKIHIGNMF